MIKFLNLRIQLLFLVLILLLGFFLRFHNYTVWPRHGATFDEFAWTWLGINLIQKGVPISWSPHSQYKERQHLRYQGAAFWIVKPYLEHPPLFGLVAGGFAILNGAHNMYDVTLAKIRPLSLTFGVLSILMVFIWTREIYGVGIALLSSLLYSIVPTIVIGSRIVQNENFFIPFFLLCLYYIVVYIKTGKRWFRNIAVLLASLLVLAKIPWIVAPASLAMIFLYHKKWQDTFIIIGSTVLFLSLFIFYGIYFDKHLFFDLWSLQLSRYDISFAGLFSLFTKPFLADRHYLDGWVYFGFISIFLMCCQFKRHIFILFPFMAYFLIFVLAIPDEPGHGWYRYPFYPFLLISISIFLKEYFIKNPFLTFLFFTFISLPLFEHLWVHMFGFNYLTYRLVIIANALILLTLFFRNKIILMGAKLFSYGWFFMLIFLTIWSVLLYNEQ